MHLYIYIYIYLIVEPSYIFEICLFPEFQFASTTRKVHEIGAVGIWKLTAVYLQAMLFNGDASVTESPTSTVGRLTHRRTGSDGS